MALPTRVTLEIVTPERRLTGFTIKPLNEDYIGALRATPVRSAAAGVVDHRADGFGDGCIGCTAGNGFGNHVELWHPDGTATLYAHLRADTGLPSLGASLPCGALLGASGASGNVTGPHLHFGVTLNGALVDPALFLPPP